MLSIQILLLRFLENFSLPIQTMFQSCLICTDFSDGLQRLVDFVPQLKQSGFTKIVFFNSVPLWQEGEVPRVDDEKVAEASERFKEALSDVDSGVQVEIEVISGKPLDTIPRVLKKHEVDVILIGTPIRSLLKEKFVGSTSTGLSKLTEKPLMIIRPQLVTTYTTEELGLRCQHLWRYLLIPYKEGKAGRYLIDRIKHQITTNPNSSLQRCLLMSVVEEVGRASVLKDLQVREAEEKLATVKSELESLGVEVDTQVRQGNPIQEIMSAALEFDITSIAIAHDYKNPLLQWTAPSFATDFIRRSWFPILFFSPKK